MTVEQRTVKTELRTIQNESEKKILEGYGLKFNSKSEPLSSNGVRFVETISPEAVKDINFEDDIRFLIDHDSQKIIARTVADTLKIEVDEIGVKFRAELNNTTYARDLYENIKSGLINQCSFSFELPETGGDSVRYNKDEGIYERTIKRFKKIGEISAVTFPAYSDTSVSVRSIEQAEKEAQELKDKQKRKLQLELDLLKFEEGDTNT
ncbi:HK97 family phage prohead protease [Corticicoccus populi]|uniref:HK97 family phage prohead protease n=1 Tax=Corticicoccus populi TaxID=1812821 RepID=A0ABW5WVG7_9STAP